jgi:S-formylglutathione hydrolase
MESYIIDELLPMVADFLPIDAQRIGVSGHSMGGHGALTLALRHPAVFKSVSAFAAVCAPSQCDWGRKAFAGYLGQDSKSWAAHDATTLMSACKRPPFAGGILLDQGLADKFLMQQQLLPELFEAACAGAGQVLTLRRHVGYDHGYYFIASFMADHLHHHATQLRAK